jgi:peptide/nickel transport system substrate-binding protein
MKPLVIALGNEPASLDPNLSAGSNNRDFGALANAYLVYHDPPQIPKPYLAQELPTMEGGSLKVRPDGAMEVTYRLRPNARWHDGKRITAHDLVFAHRVRTEGAMPAQFGAVDSRISSAVAVDDLTLQLTFAQPYLWAGQLHGPYFAPMHRELLEELYLSDREAFVSAPFWREGYVGSGPYRLEHWEQGVEMVFRAHDGFVLGKPKIEQVIVRFITDSNTVVANLLGGSVDLSFAQAITFPHGQALEGSGWEGPIMNWRGSVRFVELQQRDWGNLQRAVLDVRVRRALLHAIDRKAIVEGIFAGKTESPHFWLGSNDPAFAAVERAATKYAYDPARSEALLREAGWVRSGDEVARNGGEPLSLPILALAGDVEGQETAVLADAWKAVGAAPEIITMSRQQLRDGEFRSKFAAVSYGRRGWGYDSMIWTEDNLATPERRWRGNNRGGYLNPLLDDAWQRVLATPEDREREAHLVDALKIMTADAVVTPTHLQPRTIVHRRGLTGLKEPWAGQGAIVWNIYEWEWR